MSIAKELPSLKIQATIHEAQRLRGWLSNAYAQIEFLLGDLIIRCREFPEYERETSSFTHHITKRIKKIRNMLEIDGRLKDFSIPLKEIMDQFESKHGVRNLLAHGFCECLHTPSGDIGLQFQKWDRNADKDDMKIVKCFRLEDLQLESEGLVSLSDKTVNLFIEIHKSFGWI